MALAFAGKAMAASAISTLVRKSFDHLEKYAKAEGMRSVKERLERTLPQIQVVFDAVDMERIKDQSEALDAWLWQLRDAVEEAEDVLDEVEYYKLEKKVKSRGNKVCSSLYKCKRLFVQQFSTSFKIGTYKRMVDAMKKLDEVAVGVERFILLVDRLDYSSCLRHICHQDAVSNPRETTSLLIEDTIIGRDTERDQIVEWLIDQGVDSKNHQVCKVTLFSLVGIGGVGKTTLVQAVYNDQRVKEYFDCTMWVCVSNDFDVPALTTKILQEITGRGTDVTCLNTLQEILRGQLNSKKFLLIFDDVWNDEKRPDWEKLVAPLKLGQKGSKILLTTRMQSVIDIAERVLGGIARSMRLEGLQESDLLALLNKHAFFGVDPNNYVNLQEISKQIVKKLSGSPLAAKVVGGLLNNSMDSVHWNRLLKENISNIEHGNEGVMKVLRLSYHHLCPQIQACFRYCSMFQEDYLFTKEKLVDFWIGSGLIQPSADGNQRPEDVGEYYLDILTKKSFFEQRSGVSTHRYDGCSIITEFSSEYYVVHDLLHELARTVSIKECIRVSGDGYGIIPETVRHASIRITNDTLITDFSAFKRLRTLLLSFDELIKKRDQWIVIKNVLNTATKLRVFQVKGSSLLKLPDAFGNLLHLRNLCHSPDYQWNGTEKKLIWYPCSIYKLYHLQMLQFSGSLVSWRLGNLVSLRHLYSSRSIIGLAPYVGRLSSLQHVHHKCVPHRHGLFACEVQNLKDLRRLEVSGLENVKVEEAALTKLGEKENLNLLSLSWQIGKSEADIDERILNGLQPHTNLAKLKIEGYNGSRSPYWMENPILANVTYISLSSCHQWQCLPPLGRLPSLKYLYLRDMNTVKTIDSSFYGCHNTSSFPSLKLLDIDGLRALEEWVETEDSNLFPQLDVLLIRNCRALRNVPTLPSALAYFRLSGVGVTTFPATCLTSETTQPSMSSLFKIEVSRCPNLVRMEQKYCFEGLEELLVTDCENLLHLPMDELQTLPFLKTFSVVNCPKLIAPQEDIGLPSSIRNLRIDSCGVFGTSLLKSLCSLSSLTRLYLNNCVMAAPEEHISLRSSIRNLHIDSCGVFGSSLLKSLCSLTSLTTLHLNNCVMTAPEEDINLPISIRYLYINSCGASETSLLRSLCSLTSLTTLSLYNCVMTVPEEDINLPMCIENLDIGSCGAYETSLLNSLCSLSSLTTLQLRNCVMKALPSAEVFRNLTTLRNLGIVHCSELTALDGIGGLTYLRELTVTGCDKLEKHVDVLSQQMFEASDHDQVSAVSHSHLGKLEKLRISNPFLLQREPLVTVNSVTHLTIDKGHRCLPEEWLMQNCNHLKCLGVRDADHLEFLSSIMANLTSLDTLELHNAILLQSLPELPSSLQHLQILGCHPVLERRCQKRGRDWHKVARIQHLQIVRSKPSAYSLHSYMGFF